MFRPAPELTVFRRIPFRLIAPVVLILALVVTVILLFSLEHQRLLLSGLMEDRTVPTEVFAALWRSRRDLISITVLLFLVSAIGIAAVITWLHYQTTRRTLEEVKGLARNILQSIPTGVLTVTPDGIISAVNPTAEDVFKRSSADLLGHDYQAVFAQGETIRTVLDEAVERKRHVNQKDLSYESRDGLTRTIRVSTADLTDDGRLAGTILQAQDVTDLLALEQRVRVAEKLSALHTLSAGVAHELRNPLSAMDLNLHLLEEELKDNRMLAPQSAHYLQVLNAECRRLSVILDNFMKFARPGTISPREVNVSELITHIVALMQFEAEERKIRLEQRVEDGLPPVAGDAIQISQVLVNIVVNAFHAMPHGGLCRITARAREGNGKQWVDITVKDTGIGIKADALSRMFEPFYTTKATGSGLGLAIAYRIIQDHSGTIEVSSAPEEGTTVAMTFPVAVEHQQTAVVEA